MGLLDNYTGIGMSPRPKWQHQKAITNAIVFMQPELRRNNLMILPESTVTDDWDDLAPDIVVFDSQYHPLVIIEITTHKELRAIMRKCKELMSRFPDAEYFVYDYESSVLHRFAPEYDKWLSSEEYELYSSFLSQPVINYLQ